MKIKILKLSIGLLYVIVSIFNYSIVFATNELIINSDLTNSRNLTDVIDTLAYDLKIEWHKDIISNKPIKSMDSFIDFMRDLGWVLQENDSIRLKIKLPKKNHSYMNPNIIKDMFTRNIIPYNSNLNVEFL